jgi:hypothetical protein
MKKLLLVTFFYASKNGSIEVFDMSYNILCDISN